MRDVLSIMLKRAGYDVSLASDGSEAIAQVGKDIFDLVITDLKMPKVGGLEVLKAVKEISPDTVVLLITAFASSDSAVEAMKLGAYDYLSKPFQVDEVQLIVRNALEKEVPGSLRFVVNMKRQEGTWRLNSLTMNATLPIGDPRILEKSWWTPMITAAMGPADDVTVDTPVVMEERPKMTPLRAVRMIGMAETIFAQKHPGLGYTCALSDLVNVGRGMDEDGMYTFMGADIADGTYNGYRFTLSGCEHKPARMFRVTAEPLTGRGKAYCADSSSNPRASDDGRGVTCLISGKIARK